MLYRLGLALEALDLGLGHTVLDFGSGSCWLSLILNRLRCRTISVDVSETALAIGREAFARRSARPARARAAVPGLRRPADPAARRVRRPDRLLRLLPSRAQPGRAPGGALPCAAQRRAAGDGGAGRGPRARRGLGLRGASTSACSRTISCSRSFWSASGARASSDVQVKPYPDVPILVLSAQAHLRLLAGDHSLFPMQHMIDSLRQFHVLILFKGKPRATAAIRARCARRSRCEARPGSRATPASSPGSPRASRTPATRPGWRPRSV